MTDLEKNKIIQQEIDQIKSKEINKVYPILKPGNWMGIKAGCLIQTLLGSEENPELVIGYGYDAPSNFIFVNSADIKEEDKPSLIKKAYTNLENYQQDFEISASLENKVLFASGQDFSSEKILCKSHMLKAHELLQSNELLVSIPRRRCMMITSKQNDKKLLNIFLSLHDNVWQDESYGNAPIINTLFVVVNGVIDGIIPLDK